MSSKKNTKKEKEHCCLETVVWESEQLRFLKFRLRGYWNLKYALYIRVLMLSILLFTLDYIDPFGLSSLSSFQSKTLFYQWTAHQYAGANKNDISVVILRDESFEGSWPVSYLVHAEILNEIYSYHPKAVFVDFAFIDKRNDGTLKDELVPAIKQYRNKYQCLVDVVGRKKPPIYLTAIQPSCELPNGILETLWETEAKIVSALPEVSEYRGLAYCVKPCNAEEKITPIFNAPLAVAFVMYKDIKPQQAIDIEDMELVWRLYSTPEHNNGPYKCTKQCNNVFGKVFKSLINFLPETGKQLIGGLLPDCITESKIRQQCPPFKTIDAYFLLNGIPEDENDKYNPLEKALKDKIVFYGADLDAIDDDVHPPTHKPIPGVYFHAMALDNLIAYGNNYIRYKPSSIIVDFIYFVSIFLLTTCNELYLIFIRGVNKRKSGAYKNNEGGLSFFDKFCIDLLITLPYLSISFFIIVLVSYVNFFWLHLAPIDFIALFALTAIRFTPILIRSIDNVGKKFIFYRILFKN